MFGQQVFMPNAGMAPMMMPQTVYQAPQVVAVQQPNPIGDDGYKLLRSKGGGKLNFYATKEEMLRMLCTHSHNGQFDMVCEDWDNGIYRCNICNEQIDLKSVYSPSVIKNMVDYLVNAFNNMKIKNTGVISNDILQDLSKAMVLMQRFPTAIEVVNKNFAKNDTAAQGIYQQYGNNLQQAMNIITGQGGTGYVPMYSSGVATPQSAVVGNPFMGPVMAQPQPQPVMQPQPQIVYMTNQFGQQVPMVQTPQGYVPYNGQPVAPAQPVYAAPQPVMPQQQQGMVYGAPQAPAAAAGTVVPEVATPAAKTAEVTKVFNG